MQSVHDNITSCPQPSTPQPSTPQPSTPQPSTPQPSTPQPSTPQPSTPQPSTPQPTPVTQRHSQSQSVPASFFLGGESEVTPAAPRLSKRRASEKVSVTVKQVCNSHNTAQRKTAVSTALHNTAQRKTAVSTALHNTAQRKTAVSTTPHNIAQHTAHPEQGIFVILCINYIKPLLQSLAQHTAHLERGIFLILCIHYIKPLLQSLIQSQPWLNITNLDITGNLSYCLTSLLTC